MKRRGFLKMLGIGAAVPAMAQIPESKADEIIIGQTFETANMGTPSYALNWPPTDADIRAVVDSMPLEGNAPMMRRLMWTKLTDEFNERVLAKSKPVKS